LIEQICEEREDLYNTPELNTKLFLNHRALLDISGLEEWGHLKNLWLGHNGFTQIRGLDSLSNLTCLFLEENNITKIEGLDSLVNLVHLNLSDNEITKIEGLSTCASLFTLELQKNEITDISGLLECPSVGVLNMVGNKVGEDQDLLAVLESLTNLSVFYGKGNPVISSIKQYRKKVISRVPSINFLDNRPIMDVERVMAVAWSEGGRDAEKQAKADFHAEVQETEQRNMKAWNDKRAEAKQAAMETAAEGGKWAKSKWTPYATYSSVDDPLYAKTKDTDEQDEKYEEEEEDSDDEPVPELEDMAEQEEEKAPPTIDWLEWDDMLLDACEEHMFHFGEVSAFLNKRLQTSDAFDSESVRLRYAELDQANWSADLFF